MYEDEIRASDIYGTCRLNVMQLSKKYRVSYAQNREDIILDAFFPDIENGFYVDIGANHPVSHSVTKLFYDKGWRGINVEPNIDLYSLIVKDRPKDINVNKGVGDKAGKLLFRIYHSPDNLAGLSTFSKEMVEQYTIEGGDFTKLHEDVEVDIITLKELFDEQKVDSINFLKVDVEGFEYEVLNGNDWKKYRPELICIESNHINKNWRPTLEKNAYKNVFNDGLNDYYLSEECLYRADNFDYAKTFLLDKPVLYADYVKEIDAIQANLDRNAKEVASLSKRLQKSNLDFHELNARYSSAMSEIADQSQELLKYDGIRNQFSALLGSLRKKISR